MTPPPGPRTADRALSQAWGLLNRFTAWSRPIRGLSSESWEQMMAEGTAWVEAMPHLAIEAEAASPPLTVERLARALHEHKHKKEGALRIRADHMRLCIAHDCAAAILAEMERGRGGSG